MKKCSRKVRFCSKDSTAPASDHLEGDLLLIEAGHDLGNALGLVALQVTELTSIETPRVERGFRPEEGVESTRPNP